MRISDIVIFSLIKIFLYLDLPLPDAQLHGRLNQYSQSEIMAINQIYFGELNIFLQKKSYSKKAAHDIRFDIHFRPSSNWDLSLSPASRRVSGSHVTK